MTYCENCHRLCEYRCPTCRSTKLREVTEEDYCLVEEYSEMQGHILSDLLKQNEIPAVTMPSGNGARTFFGLSLGYVKIFVPYKNLDTAKKVIEDALDGNNAEDALDDEKGDDLR